MNFIDELTWRGMLHDITPGAREDLDKGMRSGYIGFDPTAPSLTIGNYVQIMILSHWQRAGHKPIFLLGCLLYTSPSPRDATLSRMPSSA